MLDDLRKFIIKRTFGGWRDASVGKMLTMRVRRPKFSLVKQSGHGDVLCILVISTLRRLEAHRLWELTNRMSGQTRELQAN